MNTSTPVDPLTQLDSIIQVTLRQKILAALQKSGISLHELTQLLKMYQKTIDQELKAKALDLKKQDLAYKMQKLAADQAKQEAKQAQEEPDEWGAPRDAVEAELMRRIAQSPDYVGPKVLPIVASRPNK